MGNAMIRGDIQPSEAPNGEAWPPDPVALIRFLRGGEFRIGAGESLRTVVLLDRLAAAGRAPHTPEEAAHWLAPVLCTSARQQAMLPERLRAFAAETETSPSSPSPPPFVEPKIRHATLPRFWRRFSLIIVAVLLGFGLLIYFLPSRAPSPPPAPPTDSGPTVQPDLLTWNTLVPFLPLAGVPPLVWMLFVRVRRRRQPVLNRRPYEGRVRVTLQPGGKSLHPFGGADLSRSVQGMRAHRRIPSLKPDPQASARATAAASGCLVLVPGWRPRLPDYPIIVEALSTRDHLAALARSLDARLSEESVPHTLYLFSADPHLLRTESNTPVTLADLAARYQEDVLVIVSDGDKLLDRFLGTLHPSLAELEAWRLVVLLTPVPRRRWSWRERRLAEAGLVVLPATPEGVRVMGDFLRTDGRRPHLALERPPVRPGPLVVDGRDALRWHTDRAPSEVEREGVLDAIALELPPRAFELVCVLALFPELRPDLTLHAAKHLRGPRGGPIVDEEGFAAIAALPWFRFGRMPDWLRLDLARSVRPERADEARGMFAVWLSTPSGGGPALEITAETLGRAVSEDAARNPTSTVRDTIFLRFCNREDLTELDLEVPNAVVQAVRSKTIRVERAILVATLLLSLGLAGVGFVGDSVRHVLQTVLDFKLFGLQLWDGLFYGWLLSSGVGVAGGLWHALRGSSSPAGRYGLIPLAASVVCSFCFPLLELTRLPAPRDWLFIAGTMLPCIAMGVAPARKDRKFLPSTASFDRVGTSLPAIILVVLGVFGAAVAVVSEQSLDNNSVFWIAPYAVGIAMLYARWTGLRALDMIVHAVIASLPIYMLFAIPVLPSFISHGAISITLVLPHLGCALATSTAQNTKAWTPAALCVGAALAQVAFITPLIVTSGVKATGSVFLAYSGVAYPVLPALAVLLPIALSRADALRRTAPWIAAVAAAFSGAAMAQSIALSGSLWPALDQKLPIFAIPLGLGVALISGFWPVPAALGWTRAKLEGASRVVAVQAAIDMYRADLRPVAVVLLWFIGLRIVVANASLDLTALYLPAGVWLALRFGPAGLPLLLWGALPLLVGMDLGVVQTRPDPGLFAACVIVHRLVAEPQVRARLPMLNQLRATELLAAVLVGGLELVLHLPSNVAVGGNLGFALGTMIVLVGAAGTPRTAVWTAVGFSGLITGVTARVGQSVEAPAWLGVNYAVNPISLLLLYEVGRMWVKKFAPENQGHRDWTFGLGFLIGCLLLDDAAQRIAGLVEYVPGMLPRLTAFLLIGAVAGRSLPIALIAALGVDLAVGALSWIAVTLFALPINPSYLAIPSDLASALTLLIRAVSELSMILPAVVLGWHLARWSASSDAIWLLRYGFQPQFDGPVERALALGREFISTLYGRIAHQIRIPNFSEWPARLFSFVRVAVAVRTSTKVTSKSRDRVMPSEFQYSSFLNRVTRRLTIWLFVMMIAATPLLFSQHLANTPVNWLEQIRTPEMSRDLMFFGFTVTVISLYNLLQNQTVFARQNLLAFLMLLIGTLGICFLAASSMSMNEAFIQKGSSLGTSGLLISSLSILFSFFGEFLSVAVQGSLEYQRS